MRQAMTSARPRRRSGAPFVLAAACALILAALTGFPPAALWAQAGAFMGVAS